MTFDYVEPDDLEEALERLAEDGEDAVALAGGTSVTILLRQGLIRPRRIVGLRRLGELRGISSDERGLRIGAHTTHSQVERSPLVGDHHAALAATFAEIATVRIRNQATIGGNLAHADPSQDPPPTLIAFDASVAIAGPGGVRRDAPVDGFFLDQLTPALEPGELILGVDVPPVAPGTRATFRKFLPRSADDYATVSVAAVARLDDDGRIAHLRIALGGVGATPIRARTVEAALVGEVPRGERIRDAAALVRDEIDPLDDVRGSAAYKREMARVWVGRALESVTGVTA